MPGCVSIPPASHSLLSDFRQGLVIFFPVSLALACYLYLPKKKERDPILAIGSIIIRSQINYWARPLFDVRIRPDVDVEQLQAVGSNADSPIQKRLDNASTRQHTAGEVFL